MLTLRRMKWFTKDPKHGFVLPLLNDIAPNAAKLVQGINAGAPGHGGGFEWMVG